MNDQMLPEFTEADYAEDRRLEDRLEYEREEDSKFYPMIYPWRESHGDEGGF